MADPVTETATQAKGIANKVWTTTWSVAKPLAIAFAATSVIGLAVGGGSAALAAASQTSTGMISFESAMGLPLEGVTEGAQKLSEGATWLAEQIGTATSSAGASTYDYSI